MNKIQAVLKREDALPPSPSLLPKLLPYLGDVNANFDEVVKLIALDQALTAKLLQICNSAFFGQDEPVTSVTDAVSRVGYQSVYLLTAMINGSSTFAGQGQGTVDAAKLWEHSVAAAFHTKSVAESTGLDANLLLTAGLLHDIGKQILAQIDSPLSGLKFQQPTSSATLTAELAAYDCNHAEAGACLLEKWNLPSTLVACVRFHHDPVNAGQFQRLAACVAAGNLLAHGREHPKLLVSQEFLQAMNLLQLDMGMLPRWRSQFEKSSELIASLSQLPATEHKFPAK